MSGYNPEFLSAVRAKRAKAEFERARHAVEAEALRLERAAREAADAIVAGAVAEARAIMAAAYDKQGLPKRPVAEIMREVADEFGLPVPALRARKTRQKARVQEARRECVRRAWQERPDLTQAQIAKALGADRHWVANTVKRGQGG